MMCHWSVLSFQEKKLGGTEWFIQKHRGERFVILPVINNPPIMEEKALTVFFVKFRVLSDKQYSCAYSTLA